MPKKTLQSQPEPDEIEITVIGPGLGESIIVHAGNGRWIIIDSCIDEKTGRPVALSYLDDIGVDAKNAVELIIATHWHDDHIKGLDEIVRVCENAKFCCSSALRHREFMQLVCAYGDGGVGVYSRSTKVLFQILSLLNERETRSRGSSIHSPELALANCILWEQFAPFSAKLFALSPSSTQVTVALAEISKHIEEIESERGAIRRLPPRGPNNTSVVLWFELEFGSEKECLLLGADLERTAEPNTGWSAVLKLRRHHSSKASVFKIPHHGSENGHSAEVWEHMLCESPIAIVTPFHRGGVCLPRISDLERIDAHAGFAFITQNPKDLSKTYKHGAGARTVKEKIRYIRRVSGPLGRVRSRRKMKPGETWKHELFRNAMEIKELLKMD